MQYSPRNITVACNHKGLTHFGGIYFFHEFLRVLQLRNFLSRNLRYFRRNHRYSISQMILALVYPLVLGLDRLETASFLRSNGTFQYLTGLPSFRDPQTLRRFFLYAPESFWRQMHFINYRGVHHFIPKPAHRSRLIFDLDSTVVTGVRPPRRGSGWIQPALSRQTFLQSTALHRDQLPLISGIRNYARATPEPGTAALSYSILASPTYLPTFE